MSAPRALGPRLSLASAPRCIAVLAVLLLLAACGRNDDAAGAARSNGEHTLATLAETAGIDARPQTAPETADDGTPRVDRIDPCILITKDEAETIVRAPLQEAQPFNLGSGRPSCTYGASASTTAQVQIYLGTAAESLIATHRRLGGDLIELEELGEGAFLRHTTLHFAPSGIPTVISVVRLVDAKTLHPAMIAAARTVAERIAAPPPAGASTGDAGTPATPAQ